MSDLLTKINDSSDRAQWSIRADEASWVPQAANAPVLLFPLIAALPALATGVFGAATGFAGAFAGRVQPRPDNVDDLFPEL